MMKTKKIQTILVPVSLSREGRIALKQAECFRKAFGSKLVVLHIIPGGLFSSRFINPEGKSAGIVRALNRLEKFVKKELGGKLPDHIELAVTSGKLVPAILKATQVYKSDLVIIKKSHRIIGKFGTFRKHNADKLIGESICPVLTIQQDKACEGIKEILVPVDITKRTDIKVQWLILLARYFGARVHVFSVLRFSRGQQWKNPVYRKAWRIRKEVTEAGIECEMKIVHEPAAPRHEALLKYADMLRPDLIMIMTHQETILNASYIGKFASEVIHRAVQPVFNVVPRKETIFHV